MFGESVNTRDRGHYLTSVGVLKPCTLFSLYSGGIVFPFFFPGSVWFDVLLVIG